MRYYLIAGEASGDLHASNLMRALKAQDAEAEFRFFGGDLMQAVGGTLVKHYRELAYMGFVPVLMHLRTIFANMRLCKKDVEDWAPDALILVDYPGFNLSIAEYVHKNTKIPVYYYISPKIWAWKERRIKNMRDELQLKSRSVFTVDKNIRRHQIEWFYKITMSLSCLVFFLIGAPLGAIIRKGGLGMPIIVSVFTFIVYYILDTSGTKLAREGEIPVWWGVWMSTAVLAPLGIFLTYQANKDSGVFNPDIYKSVFRWLFGLRAKRNNVLKEVIIDDPNYDRISNELVRLSADCKEYRHLYLQRLLPNYVEMFCARNGRDRMVIGINGQLTHIVNQLSNSRSQEIINKINTYPTLSVGAHTSPFPREWMNMAAGGLLPIGLLLYVRAVFFRRRLKVDLKRIVKINKEIHYIINERKL